MLARIEMVEIVEMVVVGVEFEQYVKRARQKEKGREGGTRKVLKAGQGLKGGSTAGPPGMYPERYIHRGTIQRRFPWLGNPNNANNPLGFALVRLPGHSFSFFAHSTVSTLS